MSHRLLVNPGTPQAWEIELKLGVNRIGRGEQNDFTINHASISTHHCEITVTDTAVFLKDLGSTNGTFVERVPVTEIQLYPRQRVQFGAVEMSFESDLAPVLPEAINLPAAGGRIVSANPGPAAPPPPPPAPVGGLRINRPASASSPPTPPSIPTATFSPANARGSRTQSMGIAAPESPDKQRLIRGIIGAVVGGFVGMLAWYLLIIITGFSHSLVAWGVGVVTGVGGRLLAKQGSMSLGIICGICALIAIVFGEYGGIHALVEKEGRKFATIAYLGRMEYARAALEAKTPEEIRVLLAEDREKSAAEITDAELKEFQENEVPELREFLNGKPTRAEFAQQFGAAFAEEFDYKEYFLKEDVKSGVFMVLFVVLGVVTAWKIGADDNGD